MSERSLIAMPAETPTHWSVYGAIVIWLASVVAGWAALEHYQFAVDSPTFRCVDRWPASSKLPRQADHSTLVLFLHPKCPCSHASLGELERLFTSIEGRTDGVIDFVVDATMPETAGNDWLQTDTMERAKQLANARVVADLDGVEAASFGASTSGFVMLFDKTGARQYAGGVTESRGHEGDNAGLSRLQAILCNEINAADGIPAFGCRLCLPENKPTSGVVDIVGAI